MKHFTEGEENRKMLSVKEIASQRISSIATVLFVLFVLGLFFYVISGAVAYAFPFDYGEGLTQYYVRLLQSQGNYFFDIYKPPFAFAAYPPVYFLLVWFFSKLFNAPVLFAGRLISVVATIFNVFILYGVFHLVSKNKQKSALFASFFLIPFFVSHWASLARVDMLALFFALAGLYMFERHTVANSPPRWLSVVLFALSFYTKQSFIIAPLAILLYLLFTNRKECFKFFSICAGLFGGIFLALNILTKGQFFLHLFFYTIAPLDFKALPFAYILYFSQTFFLLIPLILLFKRNSEYFRSPYFIYCILGILSVVTWAKVGANVNYFIEPFAALLLFSGVLILKNKKETEPLFKKKEICFIFITIQLFLIILGYSLPGVISASDDALNNERREIDSFVRRAKPPVLVEDIGFAEVRNRDAVLPDPNQMAILVRRGAWSENLLIPYCTNQTLNLVVVGWRLESFSGFLSCLDKNYSVVSQTKNYRVYEPKKVTTSVQE